MADPRLVGSPAASSSYPYDTHYGAASLAGPSGLRPGDDGEPEFADEQPVSLAPDTPNFFVSDRHTTNGEPSGSGAGAGGSGGGGGYELQPWRMKERMKTVSVALVLCLNIGVDPPGVVRTKPCATLECWADPLALPMNKGLATIGKKLQSQYERWQSRAKYKQCLDPTLEDVKKLCSSLRRNARRERVLFHYNGHGVPRPTTNGEMWVFNKTYTQYIPLSIYDLQTWMGQPSICVFDCSAAGLLVTSFIQFMEQRQKEYEHIVASSGRSAQPDPMKNCILLAACGATETLPVNPDFPADIFTACLTTPIRMALKWFTANSVLTHIDPEIIERIPGRLTDRRTIIGELNWIFTAVTDTIAWNVLGRARFQRLFRQDLLVASLFRNFLLAERIMRSANCTPISHPVLPPTYNHPMWQAWDFAAEMCLVQLPAILEDPSVPYQYSPFFSEQLTAFEVWLEMGGAKRKPPEQLPIVLQVLLSQIHRLRALELLARFLDLGPWAVNAALFVGVFPYVLKLLQSPATELRSVLVFIWAKVLVLDRSCQSDLIKDNGHMYFINILSAPSVGAEQRSQAAFVLTAIVNGFAQGKRACLNGNLVGICTQMLGDTADPHLRRWLCLCLSKLWERYEDARLVGIQENAPRKLLQILHDRTPEVRAAVLCALCTFFGGERSDSRVANELHLVMRMLNLFIDASPMVRKELVVALSRFVACFAAEFRALAKAAIDETRRRRALDASIAAAGNGSGSSGGDKKKGKDKKKRGRGGSAAVEAADVGGASKDQLATPPMNTPNSNGGGAGAGGGGAGGGGGGAGSASAFTHVWDILHFLSDDPHVQVAELARSVVERVKLPLLTQAERAAFTAQAAVSANLSEPFDGSRTDPSDDGGVGPSSGGGSSGRRRRAGAVSEAETGTSDDTRMDTDYDASEIPSRFYEWSCEHFARPLWNATTASANAGDGGGDGGDGGGGRTGGDEVLDAEREWRALRNEAVRREAEPYQAKATQSRIEDPIAILHNEGAVSLRLLFDPYEPFLIAANEQAQINVWNYSTGQMTTSWETCSPDVRVTSMELINRDDVPLLAVGTKRGVIRVWRDFYDHGRPKLVTAWRALPEVAAQHFSGLVMEWQQQSGYMLVSGDAAVIRVWDVEHELATCDIPTGSSVCVTALTSDDHVVCAGFGDGALRIFDLRVPARDAITSTRAEHPDWVVNVHMQDGSDRAVVSGSAAGDVKYWDLRTNASLRTVKAHTRNMTALAVHDHAPIVASGSAAQNIKVFSMEDEDPIQPLSMIRYHDDFLGRRIGPISALCFHPHSLILAAASTDSIVSVYSSDLYRDR